MPITRLAPSPTGALHLGNARTFVATWAMARQNGWKIFLRIDDLDGPRNKPGAAAEAIEDLRWLGLDWDGEIVTQSHNHAAHATAIQTLIDNGSVYPCVCTRSEIDSAASAPHADDGAAVYPGTCRGRFTSLADALARTGRPAALRYAMPAMTLTVRDGFAGERAFDLACQLGDFVVAKPDESPAYQLACVVDDAAAGVTHVVRGDDLLDSVPRQLLLYQSLGLETAVPEYIHLPLVVGQDGRRLAKRHGDSRISHYRARGVRPSRVLALLAKWMGLGEYSEATAADIAGRFDRVHLPREPITFTAADEAFLLS